MSEREQGLEAALALGDAIIERVTKRAKRAEDEHEEAIIQLHERARAQGDPLCGPTVVYLAPRPGRECWRCGNACDNGDDITVICAYLDAVVSRDWGCPEFVLDPDAAGKEPTP